MKRLLSVFLLGLLVSSGMSATPEPEPKEKADESNFQKIEKVNWFTIGGVGIAAKVSESETALRALIKEPTAVAECRKLINEGSLAGQLYGLLGLKLLDRKAFDEFAPRYKKSDQSVQTASGCVIFPMKVSEIVAEIESGKMK